VQIRSVNGGSGIGPRTTCEHRPCIRRIDCYVGTHEAGHTTCVLQLGLGRLIDRAEIFQAPTEFEFLGELRAAVFYTEGIRELPDRLAARVVIAGPCASVIFYNSLYGCESDIRQLVEAGLIKQGATDFVPDWRTWEPQDLFELRVPVEADLREDLHWIKALSDRLIIVRKLTGLELCQAWEAYRAGVPLGQVWEAQLIS
jgi:hypothetical protein